MSAMKQLYGILWLQFIKYAGNNTHKLFFSYNWPKVLLHPLGDVYVSVCTTLGFIAN